MEKDTNSEVFVESSSARSSRKRKRIAGGKVKSSVLGSFGKTRTGKSKSGASCTKGSKNRENFLNKDDNNAIGWSPKDRTRNNLTKLMDTEIVRHEDGGQGNADTMEISNVNNNDESIGLEGRHSLAPLASKRSTTLTIMPKLSASNCGPLGSKTERIVTKKDLGLHKLAFGDNGLCEGSELYYCVHKKKLIAGHKSGFKIICQCCHSKVSPSQFEAHAGCASRRKPYMYICDSNGISLHQLSMNILRSGQHSIKSNDACCICQDGGSLLSCDGCHKVSHKECMSLTNIPGGKWLCQICNNTLQKGKCRVGNAVAPGRAAGANPIKQKRKGRICIDDGLGCALCRGHKFLQNGFGPLTSIICDQCTRDFHIGCLKKHDKVDLKEIPKGNWFCSEDCKKVYSAMQKLVVWGEEELPNNVVTIMKEKFGRKSSSCHKDIKWSLLYGKRASASTRSLLSKALSIFKEQFLPIMHDNEMDLLPYIVRGEKTGNWELEGMHCAVLIVGSKVVCAATVRIFGKEVAEVPLVATRNNCQGQGYFQILYCCIERLLALLKVKTLVLPSAKATKSLWTGKFGFSKMTKQETEFFKENYPMLSFEGSVMLQKVVPDIQPSGSQS